MSRRGRRRSLIFRSVASCALCIIILASCSRRDPLAFAAALSRVDGYIASGESRKALASLSRVRDSASSASQWLSVAKRERSLGANDAAAETLKKALHRIPASPELAAVLTDTLVAAGRLDEAKRYAPSLAKTPYASVGAYAEISRASTTEPFAIDPRLWEAAYEASRASLFLRDAAVTYAMNGNLASACALLGYEGTPSPQALGSDLPPDERLFRATVLYDAGFYEGVFGYLSLDTGGEAGTEGLALMADAAWKRGNEASAREIWHESTVRYPWVTPLPYYNLAATATDPDEERALLTSITGVFPTYYPAVVRFVRGVPARIEPSKPEENDPAAAELERRGFMSLEMEAAMLSRPVSEEEARAVIATAIESSASSPDIRFQIEDLRLSWRLNPDAVRSASAMWRLMERYPADAILLAYARWHFLSLGDSATAFALNASAGADPFYEGLEAALCGDLSRAEERFGVVANNDRDAWRALANIGRIREKNGDYATAIERYSVAAGLSNDARMASALHFEAARLLAESHSEDRARSILGYALELDPSNYRAAILLRALEAH